jgi:hypothetical protein
MSASSGKLTLLLRPISFLQGLPPEPCHELMSGCPGLSECRRGGFALAMRRALRQASGVATLAEPTGLGEALAGLAEQLAQIAFLEADPSLSFGMTAQ